MNHSGSAKKIIKQKIKKICFTCNDEECEGNAEASV